MHDYVRLLMMFLTHLSFLLSFKMSACMYTTYSLILRESHTRLLSTHIYSAQQNGGNIVECLRRAG